jgi:arylsulfatase A-like enzyme
VVALLLLSAWCGLVAGLLEVSITVARKQLVDRLQFYWMTRHFIWLTPLANSAIFLAVGVLLSILILFDRRRGRWIAARLLGGLTLLPALWKAFPEIYAPAGIILALGISARSLPTLERNAAGFRRLVRVSFPTIAGLVSILAASLWAQDQLTMWREAARPLPPSGSPNVLLIVLDTVGAGHLSLYGGKRATSTTLDELATRAIRFDRVQATAPWTLPSVASMFTGRWPHELSADWRTPLDRTYPTLAEFLGLRGYATAAFTANHAYCGADSGLARGFTTYQDYVFPRLSALSTSVLIDRPANALDAVEHFLEEWLEFDLLRPALHWLWALFKADRKEASVLNREFLAWMDRRRQPERPFFGFLNYFDAHNPYEIPGTGIRRFAWAPEDGDDAKAIQDWLRLIERGPSEQQVAANRDAYDDCVAHLDEQLGRLCDELARRAVLDRTWVIIAGDHGESFGEHPRVFLHGFSLYRTERHVPLVIIPPAGCLSPRVVTETVSLRDLAATIVDFAGFLGASPFPGRSMARFWDDSQRAAPADLLAGDSALSELFPDPDALGLDTTHSLKPHWPLAALSEGDWTYIRQEGEVREELFHVGEDANEQHNLAGDPAMQTRLARMRTALSRLTGGAVEPKRLQH